MKRPEEFERKRKARDKANKRWIKERPYVVPATLVAGFLGATSGGTLMLSVAPNAVVYGAFVGMVVGLFFGAKAASA